MQVTACVCIRLFRNQTNERCSCLVGLIHLHVYIYVFLVREVALTALHLTGVCLVLLRHTCSMSVK